MSPVCIRPALICKDHRFYGVAEFALRFMSNFAVETCPFRAGFPEHELA